MVRPCAWSLKTGKAVGRSQLRLLESWLLWQPLPPLLPRGSPRGRVSEPAVKSRQALGAALRPTLRAPFEEVPEEVDGERRSRLNLIVQNMSEWAATDVEVEVSYRDGERATDSRDRLGSRVQDVTEEIRVPLRPGIRETRINREIARITVRWSDAQRISRYELRQDLDLEGARNQRIEQISAP